MEPFIGQIHLFSPSQLGRGETTLGDVVVVRQLDASSTKLQEACANGTF